MAQVACYRGEALARYGFGNGHPFGSDRLDAFWGEMQRQGLAARVEVVAPVRAGDDELARFHTHEYLAFVREMSERGVGFLDQGDTPVFPGAYEAAACVAGSALDGARRIMGGRCRRAFVPIAGLHHARRDRAAGFCVFNDIGVVIEALRAEFGVRRIAYVDIDAHHGDGVYEAYAADPEVFIADIHEDGRYLYPGSGSGEETGEGVAAGSKRNFPLPPEADDEAFHAVWPELEAWLAEREPEFVILQAGADSIAGDPITHLRFTPAVHAHTAARLAALADRRCDGRLLGLGGGGYDRRNLARAWTGVVAAMLETRDPATV